MILSMIFWGVTALAAEDCIEMHKINEFEAKQVNVTFEKDITKKFCLTLPQVTYKPGQNAFVEWGTVNKSNAQCGVLNMKIVRPNKPDVLGNNSNTKCTSNGPQPGCVLIYTPGKWVAKYTMTTNQPNCKTWDLSARWSLK